MNEVVAKAVADKEVSTSSVALLSSLLGGYFHVARMFLLDNAHNKNFKKWQEEVFDCIWNGVK
jgi:hypothetical protein